MKGAPGCLVTEDGPSENNGWIPGGCWYSTLLLMKWMWSVDQSGFYWSPIHRLIGWDDFSQSDLTFHWSSRTHRCSLVAVCSVFHLFWLSRLLKPKRFQCVRFRTQRSVRWALSSHAAVQHHHFSRLEDLSTSWAEGMVDKHQPMVPILPTSLWSALTLAWNLFHFFPRQTSCLKPSYVHDGTLPVPCCQTEDTVTFQRFCFSSVCWTCNASLFWLSHVLWAVFTGHIQSWSRLNLLDSPVFMAFYTFYSNVVLLKNIRFLHSSLTRCADSAETPLRFG